VSAEPHHAHTYLLLQVSVAVGHFHDLAQYRVPRLLQQSEDLGGDLPTLLLRMCQATFRLNWQHQLAHLDRLTELWPYLGPW
jgi:hypothetical protein